MASTPAQILTIEFSDLTALQATTRPYLKLNGLDSQYAITNTFDADVTAVVGSTSSIVPSRTNDLVRTLIATAFPGPSGEIVYLDSTGPDVINNDWSTSTQTLLRISKQNSDGNDDLALLFFQFEASDATKPMIFSNANPADPMAYLDIRFNGAFIDGGDYWEVPITVNSGAGTPATSDTVLWGVSPRNRFVDLRDKDPNLVDERVLYRDGNTQLITNILGNGLPKYAEAYIAAPPSVTTTALTLNTWAKIGNTTTFNTPNVSSPIFDDGTSGAGAASNRIAFTANSQSPYSHYHFHAELSAFFATNDRSCEFAIAQNGNPIAKTTQCVSFHSDREQHGSLDLLITGPIPPGDYFEVYARNIENSDDINVRYFYFSATPLV